MSEPIDSPPSSPNQSAMNRARRGIVFSAHFIRHGETQANKEQRIQGHLDIPLNNLGEAQATQAGMRLKDIKFNRAFSSDLSRAYTTCQIILKHSCNPPDIVIDTMLRERNFGSVEGVHIDVAKLQAAEEGLTWPHYNPPGAETLGDVQARMAKFFKALCQSVYDKNKDKLLDQSEEGIKEEAEANGKSEEEETSQERERNGVGNSEMLDETSAVERVLVVGHGAALKQLFTHFHSTLGCPLPSSYPHPNPISTISPNTGISEYLIRYSPKKYDVRCIRLHDGSHLQES